jgi:hypothetical protein
LLKIIVMQDAERAAVGRQGGDASSEGVLRRLGESDVVEDIKRVVAPAKDTAWISDSSTRNVRSDPCSVTISCSRCEAMLDSGTAIMGLALVVVLVVYASLVMAMSQCMVREPSCLM